MPPAKRRATKAQPSRTPPPPPRLSTWSEVLDAALALEETDFIFVLQEMMMARPEKEEAIRRRNAARGWPSVPYDDPLEDDPFDDVPPVIPPTPQRGRKR